jgi:hypothetical protein
MPKPTPDSTRTAVPQADALSIIEDASIPHRRRAAMARHCLKHKQYRAQALIVLRAIIAKPDRSMTAKACDLILRTLMHYAPLQRREGAPPYFPDTELGRMLRDQHGGTLLPLDVIKTMSNEERGWPVGDDR